MTTVCIAYPDGASLAGGCTRAERWRLPGDLGVIAFLHVAGMVDGVLGNLMRLWRRLQNGEDTEGDVERALPSRGFLNRIAGSRIQGLIKHSWHIPVGLL